MTAGTPFGDVPNPHLGHAITALKKRPEFSIGVPRAYRDLAEACWAENPEARPTFVGVLESLTAMRADQLGSTDPMPIVDLPKRIKDYRERHSPGAQLRQVFVLGPDLSSGGDYGMDGGSGIILGGDGGSSHQSRGGSGSGSGAIVVGVSAHASLHSCMPRSRLAGVPEGNESSEEASSDTTLRGV